MTKIVNVSQIIAEKNKDIHGKKPNTHCSRPRFRSEGTRREMPNLATDSKGSETEPLARRLNNTLGRGARGSWDQRQAMIRMALIR